jgi:hypothetical protein
VVRDDESRHLSNPLIFSAFLLELPEAQSLNVDENPPAPTAGTIFESGNRGSQATYRLMPAR